MSVDRLSSNKKALNSMSGSDLFSNMENQTFFADYVESEFSTVPSDMKGIFDCAIEISKPRIQLAFKKYTYSLESYKVLLNSENPDHYKRSGALLHCLYKGLIITGVRLTSEYGSFEDIESGHVLGLSYADCEYHLKWPSFYAQYHNELHSFNLAYNCCAAYEDDPTMYSQNFLENACHYLFANDDLNKDSLSMMFRSLMHV